MSDKNPSFWESCFSGSHNADKHIAATSNIDQLFKTSKPFEGNVISDEDFDIDISYDTSANGRIRAAKMAENSNNIFLEDVDGVIKTANVSGGASNIGVASATDFYSPWLSTDYLELPRSYSEERRWYRFFYDQDPLVGRAIDLKTFIPLSKMTLGLPRSASNVLSKKVQAYFETMWDNLKMYEKLMWIIHEYHLIGEVIIYFEWDEETRMWSKILILDPDLCEVKYMPFADETRIFLRPDHSIKEVIEDLKDKERYSEFANTLEEMSDNAISESENTFIELNTDPRQGSFAKYFGRKRSPYRPGPGVSILRRLLRTLLFRDKIRQALTQITSRHMTPIRVVWADGLGYDEVNNLRDQVDYAVMGPDFSIVTNYEINWNEITAEGRLFDATSLMEQTTEELLIGLGMTKELLIGEGSYGAGRITLQVLDTEYSMVRELVQDMVNDIFKVAAEKNNFKETDPTTNLTYLVYSTLKFSRMALKDYSDVFDLFWNLYQNGSLDKETLLEFFNIDPVDVEVKLKNNFLTINDNLADELRRGLYSEAAVRLFDETNIMDRLIDGFGLDKNKPEVAPSPEEGGEEAPPSEESMGTEEAPLAPEEAKEEYSDFASSDLSESSSLDEDLGESYPSEFAEETAPEAETATPSQSVKLPKAPAGPSGPIIS